MDEEESDIALNPPFPYYPASGDWEWLDVPANPVPVTDGES